MAATYDEIQALIDELASRTGKASISPKENFGLIEKIKEKLKAVDTASSAMSIRKSYTTYAAMAADVAAPVDEESGKPLKFGQIVVVMNDADATKDGLYRYLGSSWEFVKNIADIAEKLDRGGFEGTASKLDSSKLSRLENNAYSGSFIANCISGGNINSVGVWGNIGTGTYNSVVVPVHSGETYFIHSLSPYRRYCFLKSRNCISGQLADYATDSSLSDIGAFGAITAPSDAKFLYVSCSDSDGRIRLPNILSSKDYVSNNYRYKVHFLGNIYPVITYLGTSTIFTMSSSTTVRVFEDSFGVIAEIPIFAGATWTLASGSYLYADVLTKEIKTANHADINIFEKAVICYNANGYLQYGMADLFNRKMVDASISAIGSSSSSNTIKQSSVFASLFAGNLLVLGNITVSTSKWANRSSGSFKSFIIPVSPYRIYTLSATNYKYYAFLKTYDTTSVDGQTPDFATGFSSLKGFSNGDEVIAPLDASYLVMFAWEGDSFLNPQSKMAETDMYSIVGRDFEYVAGNISSGNLFLNPDGNSYRSIIIPVIEGNALKVYSSNSLRRITFLSDKTLTPNSAPSSVGTTPFISFLNGVDIVVPVGAKYAMIYVTDGTISSINYPFVNVLNNLDEKLNVITKKIYPTLKKKVAVFGGSYSSIPESQAAKMVWQKMLNLYKVDTWGVEGSGFGRNTHHAQESQISGTSPYSKTKWSWTNDAGVVVEGDVSIQGQVDQATSASAEVYDMYVLWASTNDFNTYPAAIGTRDSYTSKDGYDSNSLLTQCGGINYCIQKILAKNPSAKIYFLGSLRFFSAERGYDSESTEVNSFNKKFIDYIAGQKSCCERFNVPYLDQWNIGQINDFNYSAFYKADNLHMNWNGYLRVAGAQVDFLKKY